ncbi:DUF5681 domain-containing protein [Bradyrhizobium manausense]|uniref:DUF5681 domain-containing protein n=1 Tax=Bradyrhizobium manausense TaxID=989370 RepID=UPI001BA5CC2F|nr:DUF5681 domain-containing protein [Bradyrhizobium manausense]MBR0721775.1 hypothetical protein [Bradyrhizobium manausense]
MPVGKPFQAGESGNPAGRPPGIPNLEARVRALLDGDTVLPQPIADAIRAQCGEDKKAIDAVFIVGLLQALQGDKAWAQFIIERGWGKVPDKIEGGDPNNPVQVENRLEVVLVRPKGSSDA